MEKKNISMAKATLSDLKTVLQDDLHSDGTSIGLTTKELALDDVCTVVIEVAEQEIERPVKKQRSYYSGKKNDIL